MNRPHSAVPQNFQMRGGCLAGVTSDRWSGGIEGIHQLTFGSRFFVMPGLVPGIHVFLVPAKLKRRGWPGHPARRRASRFCPAMTTGNQGSARCQQSPDIVSGEIHRAVHAGMILGQPGRREQFGMARRHLIERCRRRQQRQLLHRQPRDALAVRPAECPGDERHRLTRPGRPLVCPARSCNTAAAASASRDSARSTSRHITLPGAFPDRIDRRLPVMPRQNALLDIAVAAEALHRLVQKSRRALADPVFYRGRQQPHIRRFAGIIGARSNERHSRITSAIDASTCSAMSDSTACISG